MSARYDSSPSNLRALRDRLTAVAKREGVVFGRLQQHVGVLVVVQLMNLAADHGGQPLLLVKGGASLELRRGIPESRTSKDLDAVVRGDIETIHERLADVGADGWEGFTAAFTGPVPFEVPGLPATRIASRPSSAIRASPSCPSRSRSRRSRPATRTPTTVSPPMR